MTFEVFPQYLPTLCPIGLSKNDSNRTPHSTITDTKITSDSESLERKANRRSEHPVP